MRTVSNWCPTWWFALWTSTSCSGPLFLKATVSFSSAVSVFCHVPTAFASIFIVSASVLTFSMKFPLRSLLKSRCWPCRLLPAPCPNFMSPSRTQQFACSFSRYFALSVWIALFFRVIAFSGIALRNKSRTLSHYLFSYANTIRTLIPHKYDLNMTKKLPMMSVDIALGVERLFTNVAHISVSKLLLSFGLDARYILYIRCYDNYTKKILAWMRMCYAMRTDLPIMLFSRVSNILR